MDRTEIIQAVIDAKKARTYLEIGVFKGENFMPLRVRRKTGVDPGMNLDAETPLGALAARRRRIFGPRVEFCLCTSDDYFAGEGADRRFDVIFVDGLHTHEQSLKDVLNSLEHLNKDGVIVMHDCNPPSEAAAYPAPSLAVAREQLGPDWANEWCGDVWKTACFLRSQRDDVDVFVLDCDYGVGVVTKRPTESALTLTQPQLAAMTYTELAEDRTHLLNLREPSYLNEFLSRY